MRERRITIMLLVPQALELLMNGIEREVKRQGREALWNKLLRIAGATPFPLRRLLFRRVHKQFGSKLDFIVSGGAALDQDMGRKWELLGVKIVQGYGTTEASPVISNHSLRRTSPRLHRSAAAQRRGKGQQRRRDSGAPGTASPRVTGAHPRRLQRPSTGTGTGRATWGSSTARGSCTSRAGKRI